MAKDFYKILGVDRKADEKEIKKAYRKLARQHHPDINPNNAGAEAKFKEINEAYQVLSDADKRSMYDQFGDDYDKVPAGTSAADFGDMFGRRGAGNYGSASYGAPGGFGGNVRVEGMDPNDTGDIFESLFGGMRGGGRGRGGVDFTGGRGRRGPQKGSDVEQPIDISLGESIRGTQRSLQLTIRDTDTGATQARNVTVKIPAGVNEGARVRVAGQGADGSNGGARGDLYLKVSILPHAFWKREGANLTCEVPVTFEEAALGSTIDVPTINGSVQMRIPAGTQSGQTFRLSGRGVPKLKGEGAGDQFVKVKVAVPKNLTPREEELVRELAQQREQNVRADLPSGV
ncbi:MAG TPA: J domain-containing protein [Abditibacteriaceae bacterium]